jgi:hypothetical protein
LFLLCNREGGVSEPAAASGKVDLAAIVVWLFIGLSTLNQYFLMMGWFRRFLWCFFIRIRTEAKLPLR